MSLLTLFWRWWYKHHPSPSRYSVSEALQMAKRYGLEKEISQALKHGCTPDEALQEYDIYPYDGLSQERTT